MNVVVRHRGEIRSEAASPSRTLPPAAEPAVTNPAQWARRRRSAGRVAQEHSGSDAQRAVSQDAMHAIHNARIQLLATALNKLGVAGVVAGLVAPAANGALGGVLHIGAWFAFGAVWLAAAQLVLGRLR